MDFIFDPSLVLYLPLYQLDGASFMSGDKCGHLCPVTGALWTPQGRKFDGVDDYITIPHNTIFDITATNKFTIEAWISIAGLGDYNEIVTKWTSFGSGAGWQFHFCDTSDPSKLEFYLNDGGGTTWKITENAASWPSDSVWHHAAFTKNGGTLKLYKDGQELTATITGTVRSGANTEDLQVGIRGSVSHDFDGLIGVVRIYSRALTPLEIRQNYLATEWRYT